MFVTFKTLNGRRERFWEDASVETSSLSSLFPELYGLSSRKGCSIADCQVENSNTGDFGLRRNLFDRQIPRWISLTEKLDLMQIGQGKEKIWWQADSGRTFSVKSAFSLLFKPLVSQCPYGELHLEFKRVQESQMFPTEA